MVRDTQKGTKIWEFKESAFSWFHTINSAKKRWNIFSIHKNGFPSAKLDTAQDWPSIGNIFAEDRLPISCRCWNDNSGRHLAANSGPNLGRQHLFSAQEQADAGPNYGFLTYRMVCRGESDTWPSNVPSLGCALSLLLSELDDIVKVTIGLV